MADVYAIFGTLLALGIAFPGLLAALWLLFPSMTQRTQKRIAENPVKSLAAGFASALLLAIPIAILLALPFGPAKFLGGAGLLSALAFAGLGAAGVAATMGVVLQERSGEGMSEAGAFLRGAIALELAAAFPFIGWFLLLPTILITSLGASVLSALGSKKPQSEADAVEPVGELIHDAQSA